MVLLGQILAISDSSKCLNIYVRNIVKNTFIHSSVRGAIG